MAFIDNNLELLSLQCETMILNDDEQEVSDFESDQFYEKSDEELEFECYELKKLFEGFEPFERYGRCVREYRNIFNKIHGLPLEHLIKTKKLGVWCYYYGMTYDDAMLLFGEMDGFESSMVIE